MDAMVSIVCNTFNQESYISDALDGFLMQETSFPIEILVHDDASTDGTREIVKKYADKYPNLIKPILQTENQYSKGIKISEVFQFSRAQGKYIAFCEGDDYWTDPLKLQKQVDAMERHTDIDICAHRVATVRDGKKTGAVPQRRENTVFSADEVIAGGGGFVATASLLFRKGVFDDSYHFAQMMSVDYVWQIRGALRGGMLYLGDCMGVYRQKAKGSWTARSEVDPRAQIRSWAKIKDVLCVLNEETNYEHNSVVQMQIAMMELNPWVRKGELRRILSKEGRTRLKILPLKQRVMIPMFALRRMVLNASRHRLKHTNEG